MMTARAYTVVGYWTGTMHRFADIVEAKDPEEAEEVTLRLRPGLAVCGVVEGKHPCADSWELVRTSGM